MTPDQARDLSLGELELLAEEAGRRDTRRQLAALEAAFLGASAAQSREGFAQFDEIRQRLLASLP